MKVGVILPMGAGDGETDPRPYAELRDLALQAEHDGFDSVWVYDHLLYRFPDRPQFGIWEGWTVFAALCEATSRVELGQLVMCAAWRNPALLAKMAITADEVSGGRVILGLGAGWHEPEFDAFGYPFRQLAGQFEESLSIVRPLLRDGVADVRGEHFTANDAAMIPRGPRPGSPPILVASRGPRMLRLTAEHADMWNAAWFGGTRLFEERQAEMIAACEQAGRDPITLATTVGINVVFPHLAEEQAEDLDPDKFLQGTPAEVALGLKAFADLGVAHAICNPAPSNAATFSALAEALAIYRNL